MRTLRKVFDFALSKADASERKAITDLKHELGKQAMLDVDPKATVFTFWNVHDFIELFESDFPEAAAKLDEADYLNALESVIQENADWTTVNDRITETLLQTAKEIQERKCKKFKVCVCERYFAYKDIEVEAATREEAMAKAQAKAADVGLQLRDFEYDDSSAYIDGEEQCESQRRQNNRKE